MGQSWVRLLPCRPRHSHLVPALERNGQYAAEVSRLHPRMECACNGPARHSATHGKDIPYSRSRPGQRRVGHCDARNGLPALLPGLHRPETGRQTGPGSLTPKAAVSATGTPPQCTKTPEATCLTAPFLSHNVGHATCPVMDFVIPVECQIANILCLRTIPGDLDLNRPVIGSQAEKRSPIALR